MQFGELVNVTFQPLWGAPIAARVVALVEREETIIVDAVVSPAAFAHMVAAEAFGLLDEILLAGSPDTLACDRSVRLRLRLRRGVHVMLAALDPDVQKTLMHALTRAHPLAAIVRHCEAWLLCTATQAVDSVSDSGRTIDIETAWA